MKEDIAKIQAVAAKLIAMIEMELDEVPASSSKDRLKNKKNVTTILNQLVALTMQLNKLSKDEMMQHDTMPEEDEEIIKRFIENYKNK